MKVRDENDAKDVVEYCIHYPKCKYKIKNLTDYQKHLERIHPEGGSAKTGG